MSRYAERTRTPVARSKAEIEGQLLRFGADQYVTGWREGVHVVGFKYQGHAYRLELQVPADDPAEERRLWRVFAMLIKARLVAVEEGIITTPEAFLDALVLPSGDRMAAWALDQVARLPEGQVLPALTMGGGS